MDFPFIRGTKFKLKKENALALARVSRLVGAPARTLKGGGIDSPSGRLLWLRVPLPWGGGGAEAL